MNRWPVLAAPLLIGLADQLRMAAEPPAELGGIDADYGAAAATANLTSIAAHPTAFATAGWLLYAGMLMTMLALLAIWRLSVARAPRWAWAGAVGSAFGVLGLMGQFVAYYGVGQVLAAQADPVAAGELDVALSGHPFALGVFLPVVLGTVGAVVAAFGLWRAQAVPTWACAAVVAGSVLHVVLGSTPWTSLLWTALLLAGYAPAVLADRRRVTAH